MDLPHNVIGLLSALPSDELALMETNKQKVKQKLWQRQRQIKSNVPTQTL